MRGRAIARSSANPSTPGDLAALSDVGLADGPVIVRSSAVGEDSADASFAGQLDSIPDVTTARRAATGGPAGLGVAVVGSRARLPVVAQT